MPCKIKRRVGNKRISGGRIEIKTRREHGIRKENNRSLR